MKRIVSFVVLIVLFTVILCLPAEPAPPTVKHTLPMQEIAAYVSVVLSAAVAAVIMRRGRCPDPLGAM